MFESRYDKQGVIGGLFSVVRDIQQTASNPQKAIRAYEEARDEVMRLPATDTIPMFVSALQTKDWRFVCLSSLFLGSICQTNMAMIGRNVLEKVKNSIIQAYEPEDDSGTTWWTKMVALSMMGDGRAVEALKVLAQDTGVFHWHEAGAGTMNAVIMKIAMNE
jgi:hypothetical protein